MQVTKCSMRLMSIVLSSRGCYDRAYSFSSSPALPPGPCVLSFFLLFPFVVEDSMDNASSMNWPTDTIRGTLGNL